MPDANAHAAVPRWPSLADIAAIAAGGAIGGTARVVIGALLSDPGGWPLATLLANLTGSFLLGALIGLWSRTGLRAGRSGAFLATGVLASFTTFSAVAVETMAALSAGRTFVAAAYPTVSVAAGLAVAAVGLGLTSRVGRGAP